MSVKTKRKLCLYCHKRIYANSLASCIECTLCSGLIHTKCWNKLKGTKAVNEKHPIDNSFASQNCITIALPFSHFR